MAKTREIKQRIKAVSNIRRITKTMQLIATARFQTYQRRATAAQPYTRKIAELVQELAAAIAAQGDAGGISHPLLRKPQPAVNRELILVISSNRGLCGAYNGSLLRKANITLRQIEASGGQVDLEVVGKKGIGYFKFVGRPVSQNITITDPASFEEVEALAERYMKAFGEGTYDAVKVVFTSFESMSRQSASVVQLLPLEDPSASVAPSVTSEGDAQPTVAGRNTAEYDFSPEPEALLAELLPQTVKTQLYQFFNEAAVSEQVARMVAMKAATDNASKMGKALSRQFNRARQAAITTELTEIISGVAALE